MFVFLSLIHVKHVLFFYYEFFFLDLNFSAIVVVCEAAYVLSLFYHSTTRKHFVITAWIELYK